MPPTTTWNEVAHQVRHGGDDEQLDDERVAAAVKQVEQDAAPAAGGDRVAAHVVAGHARGSRKARWGTAQLPNQLGLENGILARIGIRRTDRRSSSAHPDSRRIAAKDAGARLRNKRAAWTPSAVDGRTIRQRKRLPRTFASSPAPDGQRPLGCGRGSAMPPVSRVLNDAAEETTIADNPRVRLGRPKTNIADRFVGRFRKKHARRAPATAITISARVRCGRGAGQFRAPKGGVEAFPSQEVAVKPSKSTTSNAPRGGGPPHSRRRERCVLRT